MERNYTANDFNLRMIKNANARKKGFYSSIWIPRCLQQFGVPFFLSLQASETLINCNPISSFLYFIFNVDIIFNQRPTANDDAK